MIQPKPPVHQISAGKENILRGSLIGPEPPKQIMRKVYSSPERNFRQNSNPKPNPHPNHQVSFAKPSVPFQSHSFQSNPSHQQLPPRILAVPQFNPPHNLPQSQEPFPHKFSAQEVQSEHYEHYEHYEPYAHSDRNHYESSCYEETFPYNQNPSDNLHSNPNNNHLPSSSIHETSSNPMYNTSLPPIDEREDSREISASKANTKSISNLSYHVDVSYAAAMTETQRALQRARAME